MNSLDDTVKRLAMRINSSNNNKSVQRRQGMKSLMAICVIAGVILASTSVATAVMTITADADSFANGADISTAFANVILSSTSAGSIPGTVPVGEQVDGKVYARIPVNPLHASTPDKVFGNSLSSSNGDGNPHNEVWAQNGSWEYRLKAEIIGFAKTVEVDVICNDDDESGDFGVMELYDGSGGLITQVTTTDAFGDPGPLVGRGTSETLSYNTGSWNIRYVIISGADYDTISVDNFRATAIPAPGALLLGSIGIALVGWLRRKRSL